MGIEGHPTLWKVDERKGDYFTLYGKKLIIN
jgi:hypothetical protein